MLKKILWILAIVICLLCVYFFFIRNGKYGIKFPESSKPKLRNTQLAIDEIKEIGELIAAEYYGEVYADLEEAYIDLMIKYGDSLNLHINELKEKYPQIEDMSVNLQEHLKLETDFKIETEIYEQKEQNFRKRDDDFKYYTDIMQKNKENLNTNKIKYKSEYEYAEDMIKQFKSERKDIEKEIISLKKEKENTQEQIASLKKSNRSKANEKMEEKIKKLNLLISRIAQYEREFVKADSTLKANENKKDTLKNLLANAEYSLDTLHKKYNDLEKIYEKSKDLFEKEQKKYYDKKQKYEQAKNNLIENKRKLLYLGRGWVQAGINLQNITSKNFSTITKNFKSYTVFKIDPPQIIDTVINPYFNYKKGIFGYEIIELSKNNITDYEALAVKQKCREKLAQAAIDKGVLDKARESVRETLQNFFGLVGAPNVIIQFSDEKTPTLYDFTNQNQLKTDTLKLQSDTLTDTLKAKLVEN